MVLKYSPIVQNHKALTPRHTSNGFCSLQKNDKAVVTLPFIILFIQDCNPSTPQVVATKNCLSIYSLQTCSQNFYYLHTPVLWLSKWHSAVHQSVVLYQKHFWFRGPKAFKHLFVFKDMGWMYFFHHVYEILFKVKI